MEKVIKIIGAGLFGCCIAIELKKAGHKVILLEQDSDIMQRASKLNHNRIHFGFHYPRSVKTARQSLDGLVSFLINFKALIIEYDLPELSLLLKISTFFFDKLLPINRHEIKYNIEIEFATIQSFDIKEMAYKPGSFKDTRPQEKTAKAFDKYIKTGGLDQADFEKARKLYVQTSDAKSRMKLRDFIYNLDTAPTEEIMDLIGRNDPDTFMKMYPDAKSGERLSTISFRHKQKKIKTEEV